MHYQVIKESIRYKTFVNTQRYPNWFQFHCVEGFPTFFGILSVNYKVDETEIGPSSRISTQDECIPRRCHRRSI